MNHICRSVTACALLLTPALALQATQASSPEVAGEPLLEEVLVTGTRIRRVNLTSPSPVTEISTEELRRGGTDRIEDLMKALPQVYSGQNRNIANGSTGTATLDLRNLGAQRSLVLVDGRRLPGGSPLAAGVADLNQIPVALIERVQILTGGASATYGSDAVAGVINFMLVDDFDGIGFDARFSQYRHRNRDGELQGLLEDSQFRIPERRVADGDATSLALRAGRNIGDGDGNITTYLTWRDSEAIVQADRIHSACAIRVVGSSRLCSGSGVIGEGLFTDRGLLQSDLGLPSFDLMVQGDEFQPWDGRSYNFAALNHFQRPDRQWSAGLLGHHRWSARARTYAQLMVMDNTTTAQIAPSGAFFVSDALRCDNPLLSRQQQALLCGNYGLDGDDRPLVFIARRNVEGGPRRRSLEHRAYRVLLGLEGELNANWRYDMYGQVGEVTLREFVADELLTSRIVRSLDVRRHPVTGDPVCAASLDGSDPDCVPWNIFREGGVTPAAIDYLTEPLSARGRTGQTVLAAYITGDLNLSWLRLPSVLTRPGVVLGAEYREEALRYDPDQNYRSGDAASTGLPIPVLDGRFDVAELYTELHLPLVEGRVGMDLLALDAGFRYAHYSNDETNDSFKLAAIWAINSELQLRGSVQRATRVANIEELFSPQGTTFFDLAGGDPCAGATPVRSLADCAHSGVTAEQYGTIPQNPSGSFQSRAGGNPALQPEDARTRALGLVFTPGWLDQMVLSIDAYEIEIDRAVTEPDPASTLRNCLDTGLAALCRRVQRDPERGDLWRLTGNGFVDARNQNAGYLRSRGVDVVLESGFALGSYGGLRLHNLFSQVQSWQLQDSVGAPILECRGRWGGSCNTVIPKLRNYLRLTWETPWQLEVSGLWRHIGGLSPVTGAGPEIPAYDYLDLSLQWSPGDRFILSAGVNNLLDKAPPLVPANPPAGNGNTLPGVYDALGQYWFVGAGIRF